MKQEENIKYGNKVSDEEIYSFRRIRIAPLIVIIGFIIEIYAILTKPD